MPPRVASQITQKSVQPSGQDAVEPQRAAAAASKLNSLPAKRKFQPPSAARDAITTATATPVPVAKTGAAGSSNTAACYYTVLYTKRAANKVCIFASRCETR